jgi:GDPmannose 4,6-dehydratase
VIGTGLTRSVRDFVEVAFSHVGLDWRRYVEIDPRYYRPAEVDLLQADPAKARMLLGWKHRVGFEDLVRLMVDADVAELRTKQSGVLKAVNARL